MGRYHNTIKDHAPSQLSEASTQHLDNLFDEINLERADSGKRARRRCLDLLGSYLGEGGSDAFLKASQPELEHKTGLELLDEDPNGLLDLIEAKLNERGIN